MKKIGFSIFFSIVFITLYGQSDVGKQLWRNFNFGWDVYRTDDFRWRNMFIGTGYYYHFEQLPKAYVYGGAHINWSKYTLYSGGKYALMANNATLKTTSFSVPIHVGYRLLGVRGFGVTLYTGPSFEFIVASKLDGYPFDRINRFQTGLTIGSTFRFLYLFRAKLAYSYYPISLLSAYDMPRGAFTFSVGL